MGRVEKAQEITNAKISFVSLVNKAANKKTFLIKKEDEGNASFSSYGRIIKVDSVSHYVTGVVYEPMEEDSHGNFMTGEEIQKAAYWFAKNGDKVDLQHSFKEMADAAVVETFVAKSDMEIEGEAVRKGTWIMTVEIMDDDVWGKIEKGELTGFSMGGVGKYTEEDVDLKNIRKGDSMSEETEKVGLLNKLAKALGIEKIEKGMMRDSYEEKQKSTSFWNAMQTMQDMLCKGHWDSWEERYVYNYETNEEKVKEVLAEFTEIVNDILSRENVVKALSISAPGKTVEKAGRKMSGKNKEKLDALYVAMDEFKKEFEDPEEREDPSKEEEKEVKKEDLDQIGEIVKGAVAEAIIVQGTVVPGGKDVKKQSAAGQEPLTQNSIQDMIEKAFNKALGEEYEEKEDILKSGEITLEFIEQIVQKSVEKSLEPLMKARGVSSNLNDARIQKHEERHYMEGIL